MTFSYVGCYGFVLLWVTLKIDDCCLIVSDFHLAAKSLRQPLDGLACDTCANMQYILFFFFFFAKMHLPSGRDITTLKECNWRTEIKYFYSRFLEWKRFWACFPLPIFIINCSLLGAVLRKLRMVLVKKIEESLLFWELTETLKVLEATGKWEACFLRRKKKKILFTFIFGWFCPECCDFWTQFGDNFGRLLR